MSERNEQVSKDALVEIDDGSETIEQKQRQLRHYYSADQKMEIMKHVRRYLIVGMRYIDMRDDLAKKGFKLAQGTLFNIILEMKDEMASWQDAWRIAVERIEKQKYLEREALALYEQIKNDPRGDVHDRMLALRLLSQVQNETHEFISRFNLLPAIPVRTDGAGTTKIPVDQLIQALVDEKNALAKKELPEGDANVGQKA